MAGISYGSSLIPTSTDIGVFGSASTGVYGTGSTGVYGTGGTGVFGIGGLGVIGVSNGASNGVYGETNGGSGGFVGAVYGIGYGTNDYGVVGIGDASGSYSVYGRSESGMGVVGYTNGSVKYGVWGFSNNATSFAGYFTGKVQITGMLSKGGGTFKIDHPMDPANKYLYHSFVESPDMMNVYNGNAVTDQQGWATVQLPDYFETLNKDFRYQLTCIGEFAQVAVGEKINDNQFKIRTDKPGIEVSWQITGIRKDPFAEANRVVPEVEKTGDEKGRYLHPELYGQPADRVIGGIVQRPKGKPALPSFNNK